MRIAIVLALALALTSCGTPPAAAPSASAPPVAPPDASASPAAASGASTPPPASAPALSARAAARILVVVSSVTRIPGTTLETGVWAEELVLPYDLFTDAGLVVEIASPTGGPVVFDPASCDAKGVQEPKVLEAVRAFMTRRKQELASTKVLSKVSPDDYAALFVPGGHGVMFDLATDPDLARLAETFLRSGKLVSSVCHGPCFLAKARDAQGRPLIEGYAVTGFTNAEETAVGMSAHMPFSLEDELGRASGGRFLRTSPWQRFVMRDRNLITGQNPASSKATAEKILAWFVEARQAAGH